MSWTDAADLRAQVGKLWDRGLLLAAITAGESPFPWQLRLKCPDSAEIAGRFDDVRRWAAGLRTVPYCRIETRDFTHRIVGANTLPHTAWIDSLDDALAMIGKARAAERYRRMLEAAGAQAPALVPWLQRRPLRALELADAWPALLAVVGWMQAHPRPGIYLRQVDLPDVHSKFVEAHRAVLAELLDLVLPPDAVDAGFSGLAQFAQRYGFRDKPLRLRFRSLDPALAVIPGHGTADIAVDAATFATLSVPALRIFITENEVNFLAFPPTLGSIVLFGAGYGWETLANATWLNSVRILYWGDIDTHGFAILDQLRARYPHVESFLMDEATLLAHRQCWGSEMKPIAHALPRLDAAEQALYDILRNDSVFPSLRLEQELVGFHWLAAALGRIAPR
jgi:hypothetical protein